MRAASWEVRAVSNLCQPGVGPIRLLRPPAGSPVAGSPLLPLTIEERGFTFFPRASRRELNDASKAGKGDRPAAGHAGPVDFEGSLAGPAAWVWSLAAHPADIRRGTGHPARFALPGTLPVGAPGRYRQRMGRKREQPARQVLLPDDDRP